MTGGGAGVKGSGGDVERSPHPQMRDAGQARTRRRAGTDRGAAPGFSPLWYEWLPPYEVIYTSAGKGNGVPVASLYSTSGSRSTPLGQTSVWASGSTATWAK